MHHTVDSTLRLVRQPCCDKSFRSTCCSRTSPCSCSGRNRSQTNGWHNPASRTRLKHEHRETKQDGPRQKLERGHPIQRVCSLPHRLNIDSDPNHLGRGVEVEVKGVKVAVDIDVTCVTCYLLGTATTSLVVENASNFTQLIEQYVSTVHDDLDSFGKSVVQEIEDEAKDLFSQVVEHGTDFGDYDLKPLAFDLNRPIPTIPEAQLTIQLDGMELYMEIDAVIDANATYTLNLYTSESEVGVGKGDKYLFGLVLVVDLILQADVEIDMSSGFHLKLADGTGFNIDLFSNNVSSVNWGVSSSKFSSDSG